MGDRGVLPKRVSSLRFLRNLQVISNCISPRIMRGALLCFSAAVSAYDIPVGRRAVLARFAAAVPAAVVLPAFAGPNTFYGTAAQYKGGRSFVC